MSERQDHEQLEFNDGVGDMLRERRSGHKSINRSALTTGIIVLFAVIVFAVLFKLGTKLLFKGSAASVSTQAVDQAVMAQVDSENKKLIKEMEALLSQASSNVSIETAEEKNVVPEATDKQVKRDVSVVASKPALAAHVTSTQQKRTRAVSRPRKETQIKPVRKLNYVNAGVFSDRLGADELGQRLKTVGYPVYIKTVGTDFVVQVGVFRSRKEAAHLVSDLQAKGFSASIITH